MKFNSVGNFTKMFFPKKLSNSIVTLKRAIKAPIVEVLTSINNWIYGFTDQQYLSGRIMVSKMKLSKLLIFIGLMKTAISRVINEATLPPARCNGATVKVDDGDEWKIYDGPQRVEKVKMEGCGKCFILYPHANRTGHAVYINEPGTKNVTSPRVFRLLAPNQCPSH